jgi:hypothetical protein
MILRITDAALVFLALALLFTITTAHIQVLEIMTANVLIYSCAKDFVHDSIPTAIEALKRRGASINVTFSSTADASEFTDDNLSEYDAILFLSNSGEGTCNYAANSAC